MPTTSIPGVVVVPQDPGTSPADSIGFATDPPSAASVALLASYQSGAGNYVLDGASGGLSFTVDAASDELTIDPGVCYITQSATGTRVQSETGTTYDVSLPGSVDIVYAVVIPASVTVGLDADSENTVYLSVDPDTRNSATAHAGAGLGMPSDPAIELGTVDSAAGTTVARANDRPDGTYDALDADSVSTNHIVNDYIYSGAFDGATAEDRLDNAINAASSGQTIYLESTDYSRDITTSKVLKIVGTGGLTFQSDGSRLSGGVTWTFNGAVKIRDLDLDDQNVNNLQINGNLSQITHIGLRGADANITIGASGCTLSQITHNGSVTFESGTSDGEIGVVGQTISITDNGTNNVL